VTGDATPIFGWRSESRLPQKHTVGVLYSAAVAPPTDPVAIIGASGALGFGLAVRFGRAGIPIVIGSREEGRAVETAGRARAAVPDGGFTGAENAQAVEAVETVILSVPFRSQSETLKNVKQALRAGQLLIDATVPLAAAVSGRATRTLGVWQGSAAQAALEMVPEGVKVVSALHTVSAASLADLDHELAQDVLVCGDAREDKRRAARLIERIEGLRCVDCGRLEMARIAESMTALMISINAKHKTHAGIRITGMPDDRWE
jgi:8-hydroxy-5-deazaflavin:NADPH oxidoreductase